MVFQVKNNLNNQAGYSDTLYLEILKCGRVVAQALRTVTVLSLMLTAANAVSQEQDPDFIDAFAPVDASAAAFHNEKFHEAEQALLEGLSRKESSSGQLGNEQPTLRNVSATSKARLKPAIVSASEPMPSPQVPAVLEHTSLGDRQNKITPQELKAAGQQEQKAQQLEATKKLVATAQVSDTFQESETKEPDSKELDSKEQKRSQSAKIAPKIAKAPPSNVRSQIDEKDSEIKNLRRELADAKSSLAAAELEISRLSAIIQEASRARFSLPDSATNLAKTPTQRTTVLAPTTRRSTSSSSLAPSPVAATSAAQPLALAAPAEPSGDLQVATIYVDKADLRLGPGRNHSALMSLRRGSRLAVEARQGDWYRVFAPNGQRAWIHSSLVRFGDGAAGTNDSSSVKVRGYDSKLD